MQDKDYRYDNFDNKYKYQERSEYSYPKRYHSNYNGILSNCLETLETYCGKWQKKDAE